MPAMLPFVPFVSSTTSPPFWSMYIVSAEPPLTPTASAANPTRPSWTALARSGVWSRCGSVKYVKPVSPPRKATMFRSPGLSTIWSTCWYTPGPIMSIRSLSGRDRAEPSIVTPTASFGGIR